MDPALIGLVLQFAITYGIPAARQIVELIHKPAPSLADWTSAFDTAESNAQKFLAQTAPAVTS